MKKVSIIMPAYNAASTIKRSIESIINQDYKNLEIIVLNDGSKDNTSDVIKSIKDERIIQIDKDNSGAGSTRNQGIELATGDYIMFVDSDDYIEKNCVSALVEALEKDDCDLVISDYYIESSNTIEIHFGFTIPTNLKENPNIITKINMAPWNKLYKNSLFKGTDNRFAVGLKYEDAPVVIQAMRDAKKIGFVTDCLFHYCLAPAGETFTRNEKIFDILEICKTIERKLNGYDYIDTTNLIVKILAYYLKNCRFLKDSHLRNRFIDAIFNHLNNLDKNWTKSPYLKETSTLKRFIITHKCILKLTSNIYNLKK